MLWLLLLVGVVLLAVLCLDVYATVFVPTGQPGPVAGRLYHLTWRLWHRRFGDGSARSRRQLAQLGPLLVPFTVLVWAALLWLGLHTGVPAVVPCRIRISGMVHRPVRERI